MYVEMRPVYVNCSYKKEELCIQLLKNVSVRLMSQLLRFISVSNSIYKNMFSCMIYFFTQNKELSVLFHMDSNICMISKIFRQNNNSSGKFIAGFIVKHFGNSVVYQKLIDVQSRVLWTNLLLLLIIFSNNGEIIFLDSYQKLKYLYHSYIIKMMGNSKPLSLRNVPNHQKAKIPIPFSFYYLLRILYNIFSKLLKIIFLLLEHQQCLS